MSDQSSDVSWLAIYAAVAVAAVLLMLVLYWFTQAWNIPAGGS